MAFKMKGFSGFGNSPVKQVKPLVNPKFKKFQEEKKQTRTVKTIKRDKPKKEYTVKPGSTDLAKLQPAKLGRVKKEGAQQFTKQVRTNKPNIKIPKSIKRQKDNRPKSEIKGLTGFEYDIGKYLPGTKKVVGDVRRAGRKAIKGVYDYFTKR